MDLRDISFTRLANQQVTSSQFHSVKELTEWMGALQAQDFPMSKWALGTRLPGSTIKTIDYALDKGEILRTHLLRPTWHLVSSGNIRWLLKLTAPHIHSAMRSRNRQLGLTDALLNKTNDILYEAVKGGRYKTREEMMSILRLAGIDTTENRGSHILFEAELEGLVCSGPSVNGKITYALLDERDEKPSDAERDEALARLARIYFSSHGPATINDFTWWSGLPAKDARHGLSMVSSEFSSEKTGTEEYWYKGKIVPAAGSLPHVKLLPAYDEFIISYRDRTAALALADHKKAVSDNGLFRPVIIINGLVAGLWKKTAIKEKIKIEASIFGKIDKKTKDLIEKETLNFGRFNEKETEFDIKT